MNLTKDEKTALIDHLQRYFSEELDRELGAFEAEFLLDFLYEKLGPYFYNRGLYDAQALFQQHTDSIVESIYSLEKPIE